MPRANRRRTEGAQLDPWRALGAQRVERHPDGDWVVRAAGGAPAGAAGKAYRCPGCDHELPATSPHVVAWPAVGAFGGAGSDERRHWHAACWRARQQRRAAPRRSR